MTCARFESAERGRCPRTERCQITITIFIPATGQQDGEVLLAEATQSLQRNNRVRLRFRVTDIPRAMHELTTV